MAAWALLVAGLWLCRAEAALDVLVAVKSAVVQGTESRQLIRETWASAESLPPGSRVVCLGCEPDLTMADDDRAQWREAIRSEEEAFGDLLTHELNCTDSYFSLVEKVTGFFRWLHHGGHDAMPTFVMLADVDVYVNVPKLLRDVSQSENSPRRRFYAGQVVQTQLRVRLQHIRDSRQKNFVSPEHSPIKDKPLYVTGAHYILSADVVEFLGRNYYFLRGLGSLEDASVGLWALSLLRVQPLHLRQFNNVKYSMCSNQLIALGDLSHVGIRQIHFNLRRKRSTCDGFSFRHWRQDESATAALPTQPHADTGERRIKWQPSVVWDERSRTVRFAVSVLVGEGQNEWVDGVYTPALGPFHTFCASLLHKRAASLKAGAPSDAWCGDFRRQFSQFVCSLASASPGEAPILALARSNVKLGISSAVVIVRLTAATVKFRPLVESLMSQVYANAIVFVCEEDEHRKTIPFNIPVIVVATVSDIPVNVFEDDEKYERFPSEARHLFISDEHECEAVLPEDAIVISTCMAAAKQKHLRIPRASLSFIHRRWHSPRDLLTPATAKLPLGRARQRDVLLHRCALASRARSQLMEDFASRGLTADVYCEASPRGPFPLDDIVDLYRSYKYVAVFEDHTAGVGEEHIVSAFLAGCIPVWIATSPNQPRLFSTQSFIECGALSSLKGCIDRIKLVDASAGAYQAMRDSMPVTNISAFVDAFSWYPGVDALAYNLSAEVLTASDRLRWLINNT